MEWNYGRAPSRRDYELRPDAGLSGRFLLRLIASPMTDRLKHPIIAHGHPDRNKDNDERNNRMIDNPRERRFKSMARKQFEVP